MSQADYEFSRAYLNMVSTQYAGLNLTGIKDLEMFHVEQFRDSVAPLEKSQRFRESLEREKLLVDVGFGGGFPILPLAHRCPDKFFVGLEAREKKVRAVGDIAGQLGLKNVLFHHQRAEQVEIDRPCLVTFKAVGRIGECLDWLQLAAESEVYFYKGPHLEEKEGPESVAEGGNWELVEDISFQIQNISRRLVGFRGKSVPRGTERKNLVKLSSLL